MAQSKMSRVTGLSEARALLRSLPVAVEKKVLAGAVRAGAGVMRTALRAAAPRGKGKQSKYNTKYKTLRDNIRVIRLKYGVSATHPMYRVDTGQAYWGYFYEFGTVKQMARPWFRPAVDASFATAVNKMRDILVTGIEREATKLGKSQK